MHDAVVGARLASSDVAATFIDKTAHQTAFTFRLLQADQSAESRSLFTLASRQPGRPTPPRLRWRSAQWVQTTENIVVIFNYSRRKQLSINS